MRFFCAEAQQRFHEKLKKGLVIGGKSCYNSGEMKTGQNGSGGRSLTMSKNPFGALRLIHDFPYEAQAAI